MTGFIVLEIGVALALVVLGVPGEGLVVLDVPGEGLVVLDVPGEGPVVLGVPGEGLRVVIFVVGTVAGDNVSVPTLDGGVWYGESVVGGLDPGEEEGRVPCVF